MRWLIAIAILGSSSTLYARPGLYGGLGFGYGIVKGESAIALNRFGVDSYGLALDAPVGFYPYSDNANSATAMLRFGYNVLGYAALEVFATGQGSNMADGNRRQWAAHAQAGARIYPVWHFRNKLPEYLRPLEPSLFLGWGVSYQSYVPVPGADELGFSDWGSMRFGLGTEYFLTDHFKLAFDYSVVRAAYDTFIFNAGEDITFPVDPAAVTYFHQFIVSFAAHFGPDESPTPAQYVAPPPHTAPPPAPEQPTQVLDG